MEKMKVEIEKKNGREYVCNILVNEFPGRCKEYHQKNPNTLLIEQNGCALLKILTAENLEKNAALDESKALFEQVLEWGVEKRWHERVRRFFYGQPEEKIVRNFREAAKSLNEGEMGDAVKLLRDVAGSGTAIGPKILRMMSPQKAGAFDSILKKRLLTAYAGNAGYLLFCNDCKVVVDSLNDREDINCPLSERTNGKWGVADVETVIYWQLSGKSDFSGAGN